MQTATFAAGCFWGVEETFRTIKGVLNTQVGYCGGHSENPTYQQVCTGTTGHAEALMVDFDPNVISYQQLLQIFWDCHNPTTRDSQGPDIGSQYRSVIFYHTPEQQRLAQQSKLENSRKYSQPIVTEIIQFTHFYPAEEYHQQYIAKRLFKEK